MESFSSDFTQYYDHSLSLLCLIHWIHLLAFGVYMCVCSVVQSCLTLCDLLDCSLSHTSGHGIFQARIPEWIGISSSRGSSQLRDGNCVSFVSSIAGKFFTAESSGNPNFFIIDTLTKALDRTNHSFLINTQWIRNRRNLLCFINVVYKNSYSWH